MKITSTRKFSNTRKDKIHAVRILPLGAGSVFDTDYVVTYRVVTQFGMTGTLPRFHHNVTPSSMKRIQRLIAHWTRRAIEGGIECLRRNRDEDDIEYLPAGDAGVFPAAHPRPLPAGLEDSYDSYYDFEQDVVRLWSLEECLCYPDSYTCMKTALYMLRDIAWNDGYDGLLPAYEKFVAVCQDNMMLMAADRLLQDYAPGADRDSRYYGQVRR